MPNLLVKLSKSFMSYPAFAEVEFPECLARNLIAAGDAVEMKPTVLGPALDHVPAEPLAAALNKMIQPAKVARK